MHYRLILLLTLLVAAGYGCGPKVLPSGPGSPSTRKEATKATQRPYRIRGITYYPIPSAKGYSENGIASWYGGKFHGRKTANGEVYDMYGMTAAHKTLPMNTVLLVKNLSNDRSVIVRVNDRGPFVKSRIIDLSYTAAERLGIAKKGISQVRIVAMQEGAPPPGASSPANRPAPVEQPDFDKGNFYIQVGAFEQVANARKLANRFAELGRDVIIQQYPAAGMNLYRVMVHSGSSLAQARRDEQRLEQQGYKYAMVINR